MYLWVLIFEYWYWQGYLFLETAHRLKTWLDWCNAGGGGSSWGIRWRVTGIWQTWGHWEDGATSALGNGRAPPFTKTTQPHPPTPYHSCQRSAGTVLPFPVSTLVMYLVAYRLPKSCSQQRRSLQKESIATMPWFGAIFKWYLITWYLCGKHFQIFPSYLLSTSHEYLLRQNLFSDALPLSVCTYVKVEFVLMLWRITGVSAVSGVSNLWHLTFDRRRGVAAWGLYEWWWKWWEWDGCESLGQVSIFQEILGLWLLDPI